MERHADRRGAAAMARRVRGRGLSIEGYGPLKLWRWLRLTGGAPSLSGRDSAGHMAYIRDEEPTRYERTHKFLNVLDYLNLRLRWMDGSELGGCSYIALVEHAAVAIAAGKCSVALITMAGRPRSTGLSVGVPGTVRGWLFGTVHALPPDTPWLRPAITEALGKADRLVLEIADGVTVGARVVSPTPRR